MATKAGDIQLDGKTRWRNHFSEACESCGVSFWGTRKKQKFCREKCAIDKERASRRFAIREYPEVPREEAIYLAGFFDGEGSVGIYGGSLQVRVGGTDRASIERFNVAFGGMVYEDDNKSPLGKCRIWSWQAYSSTAKNALSVLLPFLALKKPQAFEALKCPISGPGYPTSAADREYARQLGGRISDMKWVA